MQHNGSFDHYHRNHLFNKCAPLIKKDPVMSH